ncbi:MAG TPA: transglutaminase family protein [Candidatus Elarobacter sp.]|jgi:transglutaminase-like putative cysteine protease|nr:transglutaminase family protein [Candidatus Elarobacter sp.]
MRFTIAHRTRYRYPVPVHESHTIVHLQPRSDVSQYCTRYELTVAPRARVFSYADRFGNDVQHFAVLPEHDTLEVVARSQVVTARGKPKAPAPIRRGEVDADPALLDLWDFLHESRYVRFGAELDGLAASIGTPGPDDDLVAWFRAASKAIHDAFTYETGTTTVRTTVEESIAMRRGVCQDFAHVLIALCRRAGVAARYVSGYVHSGGGETLGAEASHAWAEAYLGPRGWVGIDPTNDTWIGDQFVRIATGRDYRDVSPVRGTYVGASSSTMSVDVAVEALSPAQQREPSLLEQQEQQQQ